MQRHYLIRNLNFELLHQLTCKIKLDKVVVFAQCGVANLEGAIYKNLLFKLSVLKKKKHRRSGIRSETETTQHSWSLVIIHRKAQEYRDNTKKKKTMLCSSSPSGGWFVLVQRLQLLAVNWFYIQLLYKQLFFLSFGPSFKKGCGGANRLLYGLM